MAPRPRSQHAPRLPVLGNGFVAVRSIEASAIEALMGKLHEIKDRDAAVRIAQAASAEGPSARLISRKFFEAMGIKRGNQPRPLAKSAIQSIQSRQKSVNRPIEYASFDDVDLWQDEKNIYVGATFAPTADAKLRREQQAMLEIAAEIGGGDAEAARPYQPKALFAVIGKSAMAGTVSEVIEAVEGQLDGKVTLKPVAFDIQQHAGKKLPAPATPEQLAQVSDLGQFKRKADRAMVGPQHVGVDVGADDLAA